MTSQDDTQKHETLVSFKQNSVKHVTRREGKTANHNDNVQTKIVHSTILWENNRDDCKSIANNKYVGLALTTPKNKIQYKV